MTATVSRVLIVYAMAILSLPHQLRGEVGAPTNSSASATIADVSDSGLALPLVVYRGQSILLQCSSFEIREVTSSNDAIATTHVSSGNLKYFRVTGVLEGLIDVIVWSRDPMAEPILVPIRVDPDPDTFAALQLAIRTNLGLNVTISPIPTSQKIRISGEVADCRQTERVLAYVIGGPISRDQIVNDLRYKCGACCAYAAPRRLIGRHR